jgi:hypothetical protein
LILDARDLARPSAAIDPRRGRFRLVFYTPGSLWPGVVTRERLVYAASMRILQLAMPLLRARHCIQMPQTRRLSFTRGCRTRTLGVINYVWSLRVSHGRPIDFLSTMALTKGLRARIGPVTQSPRVYAPGPRPD